MAYFDNSIERLQRLIDDLNKMAQMLHVSGAVDTTRMAGRIRESTALLTEVRDEMIVSNYNRERR